MNAQEEIIDKVRKLLRLAQSANPHEAGLALERALRLAARHQIDVAALSLDPEVERLVHRRFPAGERLSYITKLTLMVVRDFFHVEIVVDRPEVVFAGTETEVVIAHYILGFLTATCARALREFETEKKRRPSLARRQNYVAGFIYGIRSQLRRTREAVELEDARSALAVADQRQRRAKYMAGLFKQTGQIGLPKRRSVPTAAEAGYVRGRATSIRTPLNPAPEALRLH